MTEIMRGGPQGWTALGLWAASRPEKNVDAPLYTVCSTCNVVSCRAASLKCMQICTITL